MQQTVSVLLFACVYVLRPSQKKFSPIVSISYLRGLDQYQAEVNVSCSRTQHSASGETHRLLLPQVSHSTNLPTVSTGLFTSMELSVSHLF